jgi:hypothetical protein
MLIFEKIKKFYFRSAENKMQFYKILGFIIVPIITLTILFILMLTFIH